ncbi:hypothetical protein NHQ30_005807 [Ciborinia camelliae]|nr:hypothetical protein NHQ30_005807 [Ciborinia camelliae]
MASTEEMQSDNNNSEVLVSDTGTSAEGDDSATGERWMDGKLWFSWRSGKGPYYPNSSSVFHGLLKHGDVKRNIEEGAKFFHPGVSPEIAMQRYISDYPNWVEGIEFIKNGKRYIIGADIELYRDKTKCAATECKEVVHDGGCKYIVAQPLAYPSLSLRMDLIDQTSLKMKDLRQRLGAHHSEDFWNLPKSHSRHISKFPQDASVEPEVVTTNAVFYREPTYVATPLSLASINDKPHNPNSTYESWRGSAMIKEKMIYHEGREIIQLNRILRRAIDATCLRTCKQYYEFGSEILYGKNIFKFTMIPSTDERTKPCWIDGEVYKPVGEMPDLSQLHDQPQAISCVMDQIRQGVPLKQLAGWAYHDPFLRFLYIIRPHNAALIKTLYFYGWVKLHDCGSFLNDEGICSRCPCSCFPVMSIYIQFINEFCPGVERVILELNAEQFAYGHPEQVGLYEQTIIPFLKDRIRELTSVKSLVLRSSDTGRDERDRGEICKDLDFDIAEETIQWFDDRARSWNKDEKEKKC